MVRGINCGAAPEAPISAGGTCRGSAGAASISFTAGGALTRGADLVSSPILMTIATLQQQHVRNFAKELRRRRVLAEFGRGRHVSVPRSMMLVKASVVATSA